MHNLKPHQRLVHELAKAGELPTHVLLWWGMGSGKTLGGLLCSASLTPSQKVLVLCDKSLLGQWKGVVDKFVASEYSVTRHIDVKHYQTLTTENVKPGGYDMCIVDESHRFRNAFAKDANGRGPTELPSWISAILRCDRVVYLTGTPIVSDVRVERDSIDRMMRVSKTFPLAGRVFHYAPQEDEKNKKHFATMRMEMVKCPMSYAQALQYFANQRSTFSLKVGGDTYTVQRPVRNTYNSALITVSNNPFPESPEESPKLIEMIQRLESGFASNMKQLVYSQRLDTGINVLRDFWLRRHPDTRKAVFFIDGSQDAASRTRAISRFNRNFKIPTPRILFISDAAAQGVDLKEVDDVHLLEPGDRLQQERQVINRAIRFKAHKSKDAQVRVHLYCTTFDPTKAREGPLLDVANRLGMFVRRSQNDAQFLKHLTKSLQARMREERTTVDERTLQSREKIDSEVQRALHDLLSHRHRRPVSGHRTDVKRVAVLGSAA